MKEVQRESMLFQRKVLGILCMLLAPTSILFGLIGKDVNLPSWYDSISATYYANNKIIMIGLLYAIGIFFTAYKGYDWKDRVCSIVQAATSFMIVTFEKLSNGRTADMERQKRFAEENNSTLMTYAELFSRPAPQRTIESIEEAGGEDVQD